MEKRCKKCGELLEDNERLYDGYCGYCYNRIGAIGKAVNRLSASVNMSEFDPVFFEKSREYIEVTGWANGEGVDIIISKKDDNNQLISLTLSELEAITSLLDRIGYLPENYCVNEENKE